VPCCVGVFWVSGNRGIVMEELQGAMGELAAECQVFATRMSVLCETGNTLTGLAHTFSAVHQTLAIQRACMPPERIFSADALRRQHEMKRNKVDEATGE
jgi:hypothetical protein